MQQEALRRRRFLLLSLSPLYFLIISFFIQPFDEILQGLVAIVESPDFLITDYFVVGPRRGTVQRQRLHLTVYLNYLFAGHGI